MISKLVLALVFLRVGLGLSQGIGFMFNGFRQVNLDLDGIASFTPSGLLRLTNETKQGMGHAFYPDPLPFKNSTEGSVFSFSTTFVFATMSCNPTLGDHGIAFVAAPQRAFLGAFPSQFLGLFNDTNEGNPVNHIFAIELDAIQNTELQDINNNHVEIDINNLVSEEFALAGYYPDDGAGKFKNLTLVSGQAMQVWVDYDGIKKRIDVTLAPLDTARPSKPLMSLPRDLSPIVKETMYVSSSTEVLEDWELDCGTNRFKYKDLHIATRGFQDRDLLGIGGFGKVYRGVIPNSNIEIAVKRISHDSKQGIREFVAEVISMGRLRHRNLVTLRGYCRRKGELLLVYDYMPNGSLDKYLFNQPKVTLNWTQRFKVGKGVTSGLSYLHEEFEQVVILRNIKASDVLLNAEMNGGLGDFGLKKILL